MRSSEPLRWHKGPQRSAEGLKEPNRCELKYVQRKLVKVEHVVLSKGISKGQAEDIHQRKTLLVGKSVSCNKVGGGDYLTPYWFCTFAHWQRYDQSIILMVSIILTVRDRIIMFPPPCLTVGDGVFLGQSQHSSSSKQFSSESLANFRRAWTCAFLIRVTLRVLQDFSPSRRSVLPIVSWWLWSQLPWYLWQDPPM